MRALKHLWFVSVLMVLGLVVAIIPLSDRPASAAASPEDDLRQDTEGAPALPFSEPPEDVAIVPDGQFTQPSDIPAATDLVPTPDLPPARFPQTAGNNEINVHGLEVVERSEDSTTYQDSDGSKIVRLSDGPLNVQTADGEWRDVSTSLERTDSGWAVPMHPLQPAFAEHANADEAVRLTRQGHELSFRLLGAGAGDAQAPFWPWDAKNELTLDNVGKGMDIEYQVSAGGVKENVILESRPSRASTAWTWLLDTGDLTPRLVDESVLEVSDGTGLVVFAVPTPMAWDSSGIDGERSPATTSLKVTLVKVAAGWRYTVRADPAWLEASERVYPVTIDPEWSPGPSSKNAYKSDGTTFNGVMHVGNTRENDTNRYWRSIATFDYGPVPGRFVDAAQLGVGYVGYNTAPQDGWVQHATCFGYNCMRDHVASYRLGTGWTETEGWGIADRLARQLPTGDRPAWLIGGYEGGTYSHKQIDADLFVRYWDFPTVENGAPSADATGVSLTPTLTTTTTNSGGRPQKHYFEISSTPDMANMLAASGWIDETSWTVPSGLLRPGSSYYWRSHVHDDRHMHLGQSTHRWANPSKLTTNQVPLPVESSALPQSSGATPAVVTTLTPRLQVDSVADTDTTNDGAMRFRFKIASGSDGKSGAVITSGWLTPDAAGKVSWTVPEGSLQDGGIYSWIVQSWDGRDENVYNTWTKRLKVDLRLGATGPSPFDVAGPVTVNLANGNANFTFASPVVQTLGGPMGMSFSYNSQEVKQADRGLTGEYFDARRTDTRAAPASPAEYSFNDQNNNPRIPLLVRTDPAISFDWGLGAPADAVPADAFLARWTGFVRIPQQYVGQTVQFGVRQDDGARLWVNNEQLVNNWTNTPPVVTYGPARTYTGTAMPFRLEFYDQGVTAVAEVWFKVGDTQFIVPPDWYSKKVSVLPAGWSSSTPIAGPAGAWTTAQVTDSSIIMTDPTGATHTHQRASQGGYVAPAGEYGTASLDSNGLVVFTDEDGTVFQFGKEGRVVSATPVQDAQKPAAPFPVLDARGLTLRVSDPVSKDGSEYRREIGFQYQGTHYCPEASALGYSPAPVDMLCMINYPNGYSTVLYYNAAGQVAAIVDPGGEWTTFGYDQSGLLSMVRDSMANDVLRTTGLSPRESTTTSLTYTSDRKVQTVKLPAPDGMTAFQRPSKTYIWGDGKTAVSMGGFRDYVNTVTYDSSWRQLTSKSSMGAVGTKQWHPTKDLILSESDPAGRVMTNIYDGATDRRTDSYGPAPAACFTASRTPVSNPLAVSSCGILPGHTATEWDGGIQGLHAAFYNNPSLSGKPALLSTGVGAADGSINRDWGTGSPGPGVGADQWSVRLTGLVTFPSSGEYQIATLSDDGSRVWIDDVLVLDRWYPGLAEMTGPTFSAAAGETRRIRVEMTEGVGNASLVMKWRTPGASGTSVVPSSALRPDYGLVTKTVVDDGSHSSAPSLTTSLGYKYPWLGQVTTSTVDPGQNALRTVTAFEEPGATGWLRRVSRSLPATGSYGDVGATKTTYWGDLEGLATSICGLSVGTRQYGGVKSMRGPVASDGSSITEEFVYDNMGRTVGTKTSGDTDWSCTTFDGRGRVVKEVRVGPAGTSTVTVSTVFAASNAGITTTVKTVDPGFPNGASNVSFRADYLGRVVSYTDAWNVVTTNTWEDWTGRLVKSSTNTPGGPAHATEYLYDSDGKTTSVKVDGQTMASVSYSPAQELNRVAYGTGTSAPGASLESVKFDGAGRIIRNEWAFPGSASIVDEAVRSQSGRLVSHKITRNASTWSSSYKYDTAGRLTGAVIPGHELTYGYGSASECTASPNAGASGNRVQSLDKYSAPGQPTLLSSYRYCYDRADRLLSSSVTNPVNGANAVADGLPASEVTNDARGRLTRLGDMTLVYDARDRHVRTAMANGDTVQMLRDGLGRVVSLTSYVAATSTSRTTRFSYSSASDVPWGQWEGEASIGQRENTALTRWVALPGGVMLAQGPSGNTFAYPSILGHTLATGDGTATRESGVSLYDPFGQPLDPATLSIGTSSADDRADNLHSGWHQGSLKITDTTGSTATTEMGARLYVPNLGRFTAVDPVEGGVENNYVWPADPVGSSDLTGLFKEPYDPNIGKGISGVYIIYFEGGYNYVGQSKDIGLRISQHARAERFSQLTVSDIRYISVSGDSYTRRSFEQKTINAVAPQGIGQNGNMNRRNEIRGRLGGQTVNLAGPGWTSTAAVRAAAGPFRFARPGGGGFRGGGGTGPNAMKPTVR